MTLSQYLRVLRERWKFVVVAVLIGAGLSYALSASATPVYEATAQVFVTSNTTSNALDQYGGAQYVQSLVQTFAAIVGSPEVLHGVQRDLDLTLTDQQLKDKISASAPTGQTLVNIKVKDRSASVAAQIANSASRAFITAVQGYSTPTNSTVPTVHLTVTGPAVAPPSPISPKPAFDITIGILLGLLLGVIGAAAREILDTRVKSLEQVAEASGAPGMGAVVEDPKTDLYPIATRAGSRNIRAENFRQIRANLQFANVDVHPRVIAVTSSLPSEGKTMVAINLASTLAEAGFSVCLLDADLRRPTIATALGLLSQVGLTNVLIRQISVAEALQSAGPNFYVLASGPTAPNPSEVLASAYLREVVQSLLERVDYVICDTAPLLPVADGSEVAALADGTLLVARHGATTTAHIKRSVQNLNRVDATILGFVLNRVPSRRNSEYGFTYYREPAAAQTRKQRRHSSGSVNGSAPENAQQPAERSISP